MTFSEPFECTSPTTVLRDMFFFVTNKAINLQITHGARAPGARIQRWLLWFSHSLDLMCPLHPHSLDSLCPLHPHSLDLMFPLHPPLLKITHFFMKGKDCRGRRVLDSGQLKRTELLWRSFWGPGSVGGSGRTHYSNKLGDMEGGKGEGVGGGRA